MAAPVADSPELLGAPPDGSADAAAEPAGPRRRRLVDVWIPAFARSDPELLRRRRAATAAQLGLLGFALALGLALQPLGGRAGALARGLAGAAAPLGIALLVLGRRTRSSAPPLQLQLASAFASLTLLAWWSGGPGSPALCAYPVLPACAALFAGASAARFWCAAVLAAALGLCALHAPPTALPASAGAAQAALLWSCAVLLPMALGLALVRIYEGASAEARARLWSVRAALERARVRASRAGRRKTVFLTNVSHEIRTPMTAILGFAEVLLERAREGNLSQAAGRGLDTVRRHGQHLLDLVHDLLDLSRLEQGGAELQQTSFSLVQLVDAVRALMRVRSDAKGLQLRVVYDSGVPALLEGDPRRLKQVLVNLIGNAIKFTPTGVVLLRIRARLDGAPELVFEIRDSGAGIQAEQIAALFESPERRAAQAPGMWARGGLGLSICRRMAELMNGRIEVESLRGEGSSFRLRLPLGSRAGIEFVEPGVSDRGLARSREPEPLAPAVAVRRVLVVDDTRDNRVLISHILTRAGIQVEVAEDGRQALDRARAAHAAGRAFDVVLMDLQMPVMDGYAATQQLRAGGYRGRIMALTAHAVSAERERCLSSGFDDFATKPIRRADLLAALEEPRAAGEAPLPAAVSAPAPTGVPLRAAAASGRTERWFIPAEIRSHPEQRGPARLVLRAALAFLAVIPALGVAAVLADGGSLRLALWTGAGALPCAAVPFALRATRSARAAGRMLVGTALFWIELAIALSGGAGSPAAGWLPCVPILALVLGGARSVPLWTALAALGPLGWLGRAGLAPAPHAPLAAALHVCGAAGFAVYVALLHARSEERSLRALARANTALHEATAAANRADRAKGELLANVSHDLRTPVTEILGIADLLADDGSAASDPPSWGQGIAAIQRGARRLLEIINQLLDLSKIEAGVLRVERVPFALAILLSEALASQRPAAERKGLALALQFDTPIPEWIHGDPTRLRQVLDSLLGNAVKFTDAGAVRLCARLDERAGDPSAGGGVLRLCVGDTGCGIPEADLARLFEPFEQEDASVARRHGGSGLGLALAQRLSELMGGRIGVASEPTRGSEFTLELPTGPIAGSARLAAPPDPAAELAAGEPDLRGVRVLLAAGDREEGRRIAQALERLGALVERARDAAAVAALLAEVEGDAAELGVILLDMELDGLDAYAQARALRSRGYPGVLIGLTANARPEIRAHCVAAGCSDALLRPVDRADLLLRIARQLGRK